MLPHLPICQAHVFGLTDTVIPFLAIMRRYQGLAQRNANSTDLDLRLLTNMGTPSSHVEPLLVEKRGRARYKAESNLEGFTP